MNVLDGNDFIKMDGRRQLRQQRETEKGDLLERQKSSFPYRNVEKCYT